MEQYYWPPLIHLCPCSLLFACSVSHTHNGCSWRKSCFIYEIYSSECHRLLLRIQYCTHCIWPVACLLLAITCTQSYTLAMGHLFTISAVFAWQNYSCLNVTWADVVQCFEVFIKREWYHLHDRRRSSTVYHKMSSNGVLWCNKP